MVAKCRPEIAIKESIAEYEFSVVPRFLFANDGTMLHSSWKSTLMTILDEIGRSTGSSNQESTNTSADTMNVAIVNGMAEIQSLDKLPAVNNNK